MDSRMEAEVGQGLPEDLTNELSEIVTSFAGWVKGLAARTQGMASEREVMQLEVDLREGGRAILLKLMQQLLQSAVRGHEEGTRICPQCQGRRRHQGVRERKLLSGFGSLTVEGIYWRCPYCGACGHAADTLITESISPLMRGLVCLLGVSLASFDKAELVAWRVLGVSVDDDTIRRLCLKQGWEAARQQDQPPEPVKAGEELLGSCDGTMVHTRQSGWREIKAFRFEHGGSEQNQPRCYGGAYLENVEQFVPRMVRATERVGAGQAGRLLFLSDMAVWITQAVAEKLPEWKHIADYWHACQHVHRAGEELYGKDNPQARKWSGYGCRRLRKCGGRWLEDRLCKLSMYYSKQEDQRTVLDLAGFLLRHAERMDYPAYEQNGWTISSGPMESFCKQIGQRMKGPGMRWNEGNVSPMASLVSRWSLDGERCSLFGAVPCAN